MALLTNKQFIAVAVAGGLALWYLKNKSDGALKTLGEIVFGPDLGPPVELTTSAKGRQEEYIRLGYLAKNERGGYTITASGEEFIKQQQMNSGL